MTNCVPRPARAVRLRFTQQPYALSVTNDRILTRRHARRGAGQALPEFALIAPVLFLMLLGVFEASMLLFGVATARYAVGEAARVDAQLGAVSNADQQAITTIRGTAVGTSTYVTITEIDIYKLIQSGTGTLSQDSSNVNKYHLDGTVIQEPWLPSSRNTTLGSSDYLGVTIFYYYDWKTGPLKAAARRVTLTAIYYIRLEPQKY